MTPRLFPLLLICLLAGGPAVAKSRHAHPAAQALGPAYAARPEVMAQVQDMATQRGLKAAWVRRVLGQARYSATVVKLMKPPPSGAAKNWRVYRERFIEPQRIRAGVKFWQAHAATLARAEQSYGVPAQIIVGILGVETLYGQQTGSFRVLDALATLAFDFPASHPRAQERRAYFLGELGQFLTLTQRAGLDPLTVRGSYAGAMGQAQFMPSSWLHYGVDFDGDGRVDLLHSDIDVIGSVAHYFAAYQWQSGVPTHFPVHLDAATLELDALLAPDILPTFSVSSFQKKGALLEGEALQYAGALALIELQNGDPTLAGNEPSFVAGTDNFYAITRYNWSSYYAMAVIELGAAVAAARTP